MKKAIIAALFTIIFLVSLPLSSIASTGVSINTGKIVLDKSVVPGGTYVLPSVQVTNTGTEASDYGVSIEYNEIQQPLKPDASWFHFDPATFHLNPGEAKLVKVSVEIPLSATASDYFAYIEAHTIEQDGAAHESSISGAAATKLYFSVAQSNAFKTGDYAILSFVGDNAPWTYAALWIIGIGIACLIWKRLHLIVKSSTEKK